MNAEAQKKNTCENYVHSGTDCACQIFLQCNKDQVWSNTN